MFEESTNKKNRWGWITAANDILKIIHMDNLFQFV